MPVVTVVTFNSRRGAVTLLSSDVLPVLVGKVVAAGTVTTAGGSITPTGITVLGARIGAGMTVTGGLLTSGNATSTFSGSIQLPGTSDTPNDGENSTGWIKMVDNTGTVFVQKFQ